jgi:hypothetical protein
MKIAGRRIKLQMFILLAAIFLLAGMAVVFLWNTNRQDSIRKNLLPGLIKV